VSRSVLPALLGRNRGESVRWHFRQSRVAREEQARVAMPGALRSQLQDDFAPDVALLSTLLGRDLNQLWFGRPADA
jgi:hypothetical protein